MDAKSGDAERHTRLELGRIVRSLAQHLQIQRERGRTPLGDPLHGAVIEEGEAEGLVRRLAARYRDSEGDSPTLPAPSGEGAAVRRSITDWAIAAEREGACLPLLETIRAFRLAPLEVDALVLALGVELEPEFGRLVAYLNDHAQHNRPTLGLAAVLAAQDGARPLPPYALLQRAAVKNGLLLVEGEGPAPGLTVRIASDLVAHLAAGVARAPGPVEVDMLAPDALAGLVLSEDVRARASEWAQTAQRGGAPPLLLVGLQGSGRGTLASAIAGAAGLAIVRLALPAERFEESLLLARRELAYLGPRALFFVEPNEVAGPALRGALREIGAPVIVAAQPAQVEWAAALCPREPFVVALEPPGPALRAQLWRVLLPAGEALAPHALATLAARFRFPVAQMARAMRRARAAADLAPDGSRPLTPEALEVACRQIGADAMGPLAHRLPLPYRRGDLVAPPRVERELNLALAWIRHQAAVLDDWGFARRVPFGRGLTALFAGAPGTGKTMAVQVLAREFGVDAFRVDLSRVMSKYIGETEKHLSELFDQASASGALLFFDEADALFGKRSEVSSAHDRYANVEVGYLLQRLEEHDGITVLATNRQRDLDEAFVRRFHVIIDFPLPLEPERLKIWQGMIPATARVAALDLPALARDYEASGGEIKNAALAAAFLAAADGGAMTMAHLRQAMRRELLKSGKTVDESV